MSSMDDEPKPQEPPQGPTDEPPTDQELVDLYVSAPPAVREMALAQVEARAKRRGGSVQADAFLATEADVAAAAALRDAFLGRGDSYEKRQQITAEIRKGALYEELKAKVKLDDHEAKLWLAIQAGLKGKKYVDQIHELGARPPRPWINEGCPGTYPEAYKNRYWKKRIADEKKRLAERVKRAVERVAATRYLTEK